MWCYQTLPVEIGKLKKLKVPVFRGYAHTLRYVASGIDLGFEDDMCDVQH